MNAKTLLLNCLLIAALGCSSSHTDESQGQTHWLDACDEQSDCGSQLTCACGLCVAPCVDDACSVEGRTTECFATTSAPVQAICEPREARPLCFEPCSEECDDGQTCVGGACVVLDTPLGGEGGGGPGGTGGSGGTSGSDAGDAGGAGGTGGSDGGDSGSGGSDGSIIDPHPFDPLMFWLGIENTGAEPLWLQVSGNCPRNPWFDLSANEGTPFQIYGTCDCRFLPEKENGFCPLGPAVCQEPTFQIVEPGQIYMNEWNAGAFYGDVNGSMCAWRQEVPRDQELRFEACWISEDPEQDAAIAEETCESGTFTIEGQDSFVLQVTP